MRCERCNSEMKYFMIETPKVGSCCGNWDYKDAMICPKCGFIKDEDINEEECKVVKERDDKD